MKTPNPARAWHHIGVRDPKKFPIVATIQLGRRAEKTNRADSGIQARIGREKGKKKGATQFVTLLFDPRIFTIQMAKAWAKKHGEKILEVFEAPSQPEHSLTPRARVIGQNRQEAFAKDEYKKGLLKHGVGVELSEVEARHMPRLLRSAERVARLAPETVRVLSCGFFVSGKKSVLVLPPDRDLIAQTAGELRTATFSDYGVAKTAAVSISQKLSALAKK